MKYPTEKPKIVNYYPDLRVGLTQEQVIERKKQKLTNKTKKAFGKSYVEIVMTNVFSFFNIVLFIIAGFMFYAGYYSGLFFLFVLIPNIIIGLYQDIKARIILGRLSLLTQPKISVVRDGSISDVRTDDVVLNDVVRLYSGSQICADGIVGEGELLVNESLLTGESDNIQKKQGDQLYAGSYVVSGNAFMRVEKVGKDNYVSKLQSKANKFKRSPSQILRSLRRLFLVIGTIVVTMGVAMIVTYAVQGSFTDVPSFKQAIGPISGSLVAMIPSGLYLLTSLALATAVIVLSKKKTQIQDFYSVEMLARANVLCVDKTGTITDGTMVVKQIVPLTQHTQEDISQIISNILIATQDDNFTAQALKKAFHYELSAGVIAAIPFNSMNKFSAASFKGGKTYAIGAAEYLNITNKAGIIKRCEKYTKNGYRVMVLAENDSVIKDKHIIETLNVIAFIVLQDHIRPDAIKTFSWFKENGVAIKVISGDNVQTVSEIARQAGIDNADQCISLDGMSIEEVRAIAKDYTVFGRVTPEQKEAIILSLKEDKKIVAMTGDGVNDILALKRADCSIAMNAGADAARNVSHIVLLDSNFDRLPDVVAEGRRVINNLQRTCSLFLTKTIFAITFTLTFLLISIISGDSSVRYPFMTNHFYLWEVFGIGISAFFVALQRNKELISGTFLGNTFKKAIPASLIMILPVTCIFVCHLLQKTGTIYTGIDYQQAVSMSSVIMGLMCLVVLYGVCSPLDLYRGLILVAATIINISFLAGTALYTNTTNNNNFLNILFNNFGGLNYFIIAILLLLFGGIYVVIVNAIGESKGEKKDVEDKSGN